MKWLGKIFGGSDVVEKIGGVVNKFSENHLGKKELTLEIEKILAEDRKALHSEVVAELGAKERVLVAELAQGNTYTKAARPTVVYTGLAVLLINHVILPWTSHFAGMEIPEIKIPMEFWIGWSGIVATWSIGRDTVRTGARNKFATAVTGDSSKSIFDR